MAKRSSGKRSGGATEKLARFRTSIDIPAEAREALCDLLNQQLADTADLYTLLKHAHWNVKGEEFYQLHKLYDELAACTLEWSDEIAERAAILGGFVKGTLRMAAEATRLPEFPADAVEGLATVRALVAAYADYCRTTREAIEQADRLGDPTTADLLTEVSHDADKNLWFLEAHLQA
jgi:starvation-inducible DNA-binding protein